MDLLLLAPDIHEEILDIEVVPEAQLISQSALRDRVLKSPTGLSSVGGGTAVRSAPDADPLNADFNTRSR